MDRIRVNAELPLENVLLMSKDKQTVYCLGNEMLISPFKRLYLKTTITFITCIPGLVFRVPLGSPDSDIMNMQTSSLYCFR